MPPSSRPLRAFAHLLAAMLVLAAAPAVHAVAPLVQHDVVLLQTGVLIDQRVEGGPEAMAGYLKTLGEGETAAMRANPAQLPAAGFIVVAVRPGNLTRTWFDFKPALADATMAALRHAVEAAPPLAVKSGQVVFALRVSVWSDRPPKAYAPAPQEWKDAVKDLDKKPDVDTLVDMVWPR